jgi:hypothetical protein
LDSDYLNRTVCHNDPDCPQNWIFSHRNILQTGLSACSCWTVRSSQFLPSNPCAGHITPPHLFICSHPSKITSPLSFPHLTPPNPLLQKLIFGRIRGPSASISEHSAIPSSRLLGIESNPLYFFRISLFLPRVCVGGSLILSNFWMYAFGHLLVMLRGSFAYDLRIFSRLNLEIGQSELKNPKW